MNRTILVTGANGQLGNELRAIAAEQCPEIPFRFLFTDVAELDITDPEAVNAFFAQHRPEWVINAAAYTAVDRAEQEPEKAKRLNAGAVRNLVAACREVSSALIQVSTDYVFDGNGPHEPLTEEAPVNPQSVYGHTKRAGEEAALAYEKAFVVRTAWLYSEYGNNFVKTIRRLGAEKEELGVVADQWGTPTWAADLARALMQIVVTVDRQPEKGKQWAGIYHYSDAGTTTWCEFARKIMHLSGLACRVNPIPTQQYPTPAARPLYSVMSKEKIQRVFAVEVPHWKTSLARCIERL